LIPNLTDNHLELKISMEEITVDVVKIIRESGLEVEPEGMAELQHLMTKMLTDNSHG
jgi:hypothetical protein